ncbi:MAG: beta-lactamase [Gammaproteobacteria bacterium]|nr:beta-lactamase [Gammaproteobacteria bacterium]
MTDKQAIDTHSDSLRRGEPREAGVNAAIVAAFLDDAAAAGLDIHGLMLHRAGRVVAEGWRWPYRADRPRIMHSATKSVMACAIGMALEEGRFRLEDKVVSFFPELISGSIDAKLASMTVEHLLTMRAGHAAETSGSIWRGISTSWTAEFFKIPLVYHPGTTFMYTSAASYMLSAILTKVTGQTLHEYLKPRFFAPLGIVAEEWDLGPDNVNPGGNGLTMKTADLLKLGVLHAQGGLWEGRRILSEAWIAEATRSHGDDYGYQWTTTPDGTYAAIGIFMQFVMVFPRHEAALAVVGAAQEGSRVYRPIVQRHFPRAFEEQLPASEAQKADTHLRSRLVAAGVQPPIAANSSNTVARISGKTFRIEPNPLGVTAVRFVFGNDRCVFHLVDASGDHSVVCGLRDWIESRTDVPGADLHHGYSLQSAVVVASAAWTDENTLRMIWIFAETAFRDTVVCRFDNDSVTVERSVNVNSSALSWPQLSGK